MKQNRNNRVNNKNHSGKNEFRIVNLLPCGQENAISTQDLMKLSGYDTARDLQQQIAWERNHGAVICSGSSKGYWKPKNREEIVQFCKTMEARARNIIAATRSTKLALKKSEWQQEEGVKNGK